MRISLLESALKGLQEKQLGVFDIFLSDQNAPIITGIVLDARVSAEHIREVYSFLLKSICKQEFNEGDMLAWYSFGCSWGSASTPSA